MTTDGKEALFKKYLAGDCSPEELVVLLNHFADCEDEAAIRQWIANAINHTPQEPVLRERAARIAANVRVELMGQIKHQAAKKHVLRRLINRYVAVAAAILVVSAIGFVLYKQPNQVGNVVTATNENAFGGDVPAGGNHAMLTLPGGRTVVLSPDKKGIRVDGSLRYADGSLVTGMAPLSLNDERTIAAEPEWLTLITPRGGQYHIELPDGSRVWLNAASKLRYPNRFSGQNRLVELTGEAYFEVHKQAEPFLVKTNAQTVRVLGTQFNVSAYHDEDQTVTTLVTGSVNVWLNGQRAEMNLVPGEQSVVKTHSITKAKVDLAQFINWKNGSFSFRETEMHQVMRQLSRWYNVDVVIDENIPQTYFYGDIKRDKSLAQVLNILKKGGVNFKIVKKPERPQLVVMP